MKTKGGGKRKGSAFERQLAKDIVKAFRQFGITQHDCWRSINSGAHPIAAGDLEMSEKLAALFPYCVEAKFRKKIRWQNFLLAKQSEELRWITQAREGAKKASGLLPVLVMKENRGPVYAMKIDDSGERALVLWKTFMRHAVLEKDAA